MAAKGKEIKKDFDLQLKMPPIPSDEALQIAARCWCDDETKEIEMDSRLAAAFAKRLDILWLSTARERMLFEWMEAPEHVRYTTRLYMDLSPESKTKIDNLMKALMECKA